MLTVVDNHSFREDLLTKGPVLDAGSRGLRLAKWFRDRGHRVIALDAGESEEADGIQTRQFALVDSSYPPGSCAFLVDDADKEARHIGSLCRAGENVRAVTIGGLQKMFGVHKWDLIKLNIEGSEYDILDEISGPIARQIVFSLHEHTDRARGREECDRIINKLRTWYDIYNQVWEKRYGCRENYWDVLCIERGI